MKTIKFRAWDKENKKMIDSVGLLPFQTVIIPDGERKVGDMGAYQKMYIYKEPKGFEVMQFTGLCDKNGTEIYEGDIVEWIIYPDDSEVVKLRDSVTFSSACFKLEKRIELLFMRMPHIEIIGNIYENPELLTNN